MALPISERMERLPNWAQAYIGRLSNQIMTLKERAGSFEPDPSPIYSEEDCDGETVHNYLRLPENQTFFIETDAGKIAVRLMDTGDVALAFMKPAVLVPQRNGVHIRSVDE